jgi:hypothetical protein
MKLSRRKAAAGGRPQRVDTGSRVATGNAGQGAPFRDVVLRQTWAMTIDPTICIAAPRFRGGATRRFSYAANRILFDPRLLDDASGSLCN